MRRSALRSLAAVSSYCLWRFIKNCAKTLIGRNPTIDERRFFLRKYILHVTGIRPIRAITCRGQYVEGAASQALMIMNAINFARSFGLIYVHTPFARINFSDRPMQDWVEGWENLFNFGLGEISCQQYGEMAIDFAYTFDDLALCFPWKDRLDEMSLRFKALLPEFRRKYYSNKSPRSNSEVEVAVHLRRGDVFAGHAYFTSNEIVLQTIRQVQSILDARSVPYKISIYSWGKTSDLGELSNVNAKFFFEMDAIQTMQELIEADVLIMGEGTFSYYAGMISDGIKLWRGLPADDEEGLTSWRWPFVSPDKAWISYGADGSFDSAVFEQQFLIGNPNTE